MKLSLPKVLTVFLLLILIAIGWTFLQRSNSGSDGRDRDRGQRAFPVETADIIIGTIEEKRTYSGTLEPSAETSVAARVGGRVAKVAVDLADTITRGELVVELDPAEYQQAVARAEADLSVARARRREAENRLAIAGRELERARQLAERGISSESDLDNVQAEHLIRTSALEVAKAEVAAAEAALESARIRLEDTRVRAMWSEGDPERLVARRTVEEGDTISPNQPLLRVVEIDPVRAVFFVPERDYARLQAGQEVELTTDAWPGTVFPAVIHRIAPVFQEASRQARVEIRAENTDHRLKPGMFLRATVTLERHENARILPESAITRRDNTTGVFLVNEDTRTVSWREVVPGIRADGRVEVKGDGLEGKVVSLGQQLLEDGSPVLLPETKSESTDSES
jgi:RND family efflux transporter MFP subunit